MLNLVIGAAASGKSEYAEQVVMTLSGERIYLATMEPFGREAEDRIARHRELRAGKGFRTIERPKGLAALPTGPDWNLLVEDLPNLAANEYFSPDGGGMDAVLCGIRHLVETASDVTVVTGDLLSDGERYDAGTEAYLKMLAELHLHLAEMADNVIEVICGTPCTVKGTLPAVTPVRKKETVKGSYFITGPYGSGKREYVLRVLGIAEEDAAFEVQELLRADPQQDLFGLAGELGAFRAVTQTEVGAGVIPLAAADRTWRESAGRLACLLAERADVVIRMVCGVPVRIK